MRNPTSARRLRQFAILSLLPLMAQAAAEPAAESTDAEALFDTHCTRCHGSEVYTRDDRRIQSLPELQVQVQRCETMLELQWFDEQITDVAQLLNSQYYHFKP